MNKMDETAIKQNLDEIGEKMSAAAVRSGRKAGDVTLVVVTKTRTVEEIRAVISAGVGHIGENRVQEAETKRSELGEGFTFRMIGHLQRNKAKNAIELFDAIDSVDSIRLAKELSKELQKKDMNMPVLIEVNSSGEDTKFGFEPEEIMRAACEIAVLPGIDLKGLMTIGPLTADEKRIRDSFETTREIFEKIKKKHPAFETLSMGMTDDYETAIEEGSTMVRIGRAVFGKRRW